MSKCYICDAELIPENRTDEHIILNACGGKLKSSNLVCRTCNSDFGTIIDSELADQLNVMGNLLDIDRDRGEPQPVKAKGRKTGEEYKLKSGGVPEKSKPTIVQETSSDGTHIKIVARSFQELKQMLLGLQRKYPTLNIIELMEKAKIKKEYVSEMLEFETTVGGMNVFRSICKSAVNFFIYKNGSAHFIQHLIPFLKGSEEQDCVWFYYPEHQPYIPKQDEVSHLLYLIGIPAESLLFCYIELFNTYSFLVLLSDKYDGPAIKEHYAYDLMIKQEIAPHVELVLNKVQLFEVFQKKDTKPYQKYKIRIERLLDIALKRQNQEHINEITNKAIENSLAKYPDGTVITQEMVDELINEMESRIKPYIEHKLGEQKDDEL